MKKIYLDIMEKALLAYTNQHIHEYIDEVKQQGVSEHGFPRLGANIGILMAYGRRLDLKEEFIEIIDLCCEDFLSCNAEVWKKGVNFSIREVCCALMELGKTDVIEKSLLEKWKGKLKALDPYTVYSHVVQEQTQRPNNWAYFAAVSEQARGVFCNVDSAKFVENQLPSQLARLDSNGMYKDGNDFSGPYQPFLYDIMTRVLIGLSLFFKYNGKYASDIEKMMEMSDDLTLKMQSVTGELPFGGRSNQCLFNETVTAAYYELRANLLAKKGDIKKAEMFKAAAKKAANSVLYWLNFEPMSHVKNRYDPDFKFGCENYAYFNKYMITVASNAYLAFLVADDDIKPTVAETDIGGYITQTSDYFHKVFINSCDYFLEIDCNADIHYDANGLGRVHKRNFDPRVCLSVPFPCGETNYKLEFPNKHPLSICAVKNTANGSIISAQDGVKHILKSKHESESEASVTFDCVLNDEQLFSAKYAVTKRGVDIEFDGADGILLPAFSFDGANETEITASNGQIVIKYNGSFCKYTFSGEPIDYDMFFNRNGRYRAYEVKTDKLHIEIGDINEL